MKQLTCELCGSTDLIKKEGVFICQSCGTKYSVEEAKKLMIEGIVEIKGKVEIDKKGEIENLLKLIHNSTNINEKRKYTKNILEIDAEHIVANILNIAFREEHYLISEQRLTPLREKELEQIQELYKKIGIEDKKYTLFLISYFEWDMARFLDWIISDKNQVVKKELLYCLDIWKNLFILMGVTTEVDKEKYLIEKVNMVVDQINKKRNDYILNPKAYLLVHKTGIEITISRNEIDMVNNFLSEITVSQELETHKIIVVKRRWLS